jgi:hypothetical protein
MDRRRTRVSTLTIMAKDALKNALHRRSLGVRLLMRERKWSSYFKNLIFSPRSENPNISDIYQIEATLPFQVRTSQKFEGLLLGLVSACKPDFRAPLPEVQRGDPDAKIKNGPN